MPNHNPRRSTSHHVHFRAVPRTNRTLKIVNSHSRSATSNTSEPPCVSHRDLGYTLVTAHRQVDVPTSPVRMDTRCCLGCFHQQEAQQGTALLADVTEP